jgi:hypothetical protein
MEDIIEESHFSLMIIILVVLDRYVKMEAFVVSTSSLLDELRHFGSQGGNCIYVSMQRT